MGDARAAFSDAENAASSGVELAAIRDARTGFENWVAALHDEFATFEKGDHQAAISASLGDGRQLRKTYEQSLSRAQTLGQRAIQSATYSADGISSRSLFILLGTLLAALGIGSAVVYWLVHSIAFPLFRVATFLTSPGL